MIPGKKYDPGTRTSRRPTPERFAHLRRWIEPIDRSIQMTSIEEITNINQQLEQTSAFYISTIIQRVIAQLIGKHGDGFVTLEATEDGHLIIKTAEYDGKPVTLQATEDGYLIVQTDRETKTQTYAAFDINTIGDNEIIAGEAGKTINMTGLVFTVGGENDITLKTTSGAISGPMPFGGADEPRGMVDNKGFLPLKLPTDDAFIIELSATEHVMGYVCGYIE
ncbi:hypothetical protein ES705_37791 [subsurface metagenome]